MSHAGWFTPLAEALALRGISTVAVDRPGSGDARQQSGAFDPAAWVDGLVDAMQTLSHEVERCSLFGWCWGARIAILAAQRRAPHHLVLAAPGLAMTASLRARAAELRAMDVDPLPLPFPISDFSDDASVIATIREDRLAWTSQPRAFLDPSRAVLDAALASLPRLAVPRTTILAEGDRIVDNVATAALVAGAPIVRVPGGHALVLESPARIAELVAAAILT